MTDREADLAAAKVILDSLGTVDTMEAQVALLAEALGTLAEEHDAWEKLMIWCRTYPDGVFYRNISPNDVGGPTLIAEWGTAPRGNDDGAMAVGGSGETYGAAAVKLAGMLGLL